MKTHSSTTAPAGVGAPAWGGGRGWGPGRASNNVRRLAGFAVGLMLLTGCQAGWGATAEKSNSETPAATAPPAPGAAAPDPG